MLNTINPYTGDTVQQYAPHSPAQVDAIIMQADTAFRQWRKRPVEQRAMLLKALAKCLRERKEELSRLITLEMGKLFKDSQAEITKCADCCDWLAEHGPQFLSDQPASTEFSTSYVSFQPLGVVLAIMPWNFPFWQAIRALAPALLAGNGMVLKHASNTSGCALALESVVREAGFPEGLFAAALLPGKESALLIKHPLIRAVTLTGSTPAGREVASLAGSLIKKTVLELGGSDAYIVLEDADIEQAAAICASARLVNGGQSCIAAKRFIVVEPVRAAFEAAMQETLAERVMGDPMDAATTLQPMARRDLRDELHQQVTRSIQQGATCLLGGAIPDRGGAFYPATLLTHVTPGMPAFDEEFFGPVASIIAVQDEAEAIRLANATAFGLGAAVFTRDLARGERIAREQLEAGSCFVNDFVRSDPRLPFGGIKESGYGRELSIFGIREFVNIKTVAVR